MRAAACGSPFDVFSAVVRLVPAASIPSLHAGLCPRERARKPHVRRSRLARSPVLRLTHSYAVSIGMIALVVMALVTPLTLKSTKGMLEMQRLQPEMKRLQAQHRGDRQKLNEEMMKLYQEHKVNPLASCLPLLLQMPVFFIMYRVLHGLSNRGSDGTFDPSYISRVLGAVQVLDNKTEMLSLGLDLSKTPAQLHQRRFVRQGAGLCPLVVVSLPRLYFVQQKMVASRAAASPTMSAGQAKLMQYLPVAFAVFQIFFLTGLVIYYIVQTLVPHRPERLHHPPLLPWRRIPRGSLLKQRATALVKRPRPTVATRHLPAGCSPRRSATRRLGGKHRMQPERAAVRSGRSAIRVEHGCEQAGRRCCESGRRLCSEADRAEQESTDQGGHCVGLERRSSRPFATGRTTCSLRHEQASDATEEPADTVLCPTTAADRIGPPWCAGAAETAEEVIPRASGPSGSRVRAVRAGRSASIVGRRHAVG